MFIVMCAVVASSSALCSMSANSSPLIVSPSPVSADSLLSSLGSALLLASSEADALAAAGLSAAFPESSSPHAASANRAVVASGGRERAAYGAGHDHDSTEPRPTRERNVPNVTTALPATTSCSPRPSGR